MESLKNKKAPVSHEHFLKVLMALLVVVIVTSVVLFGVRVTTRPVETMQQPMSKKDAFAWYVSNLPTPQKSEASDTQMAAQLNKHPISPSVSQKVSAAVTQ